MLKKYGDEIYLSITLFDGDESKRKEYRTSNVSTESCEEAYKINQKMLEGNYNVDDLLHEVVNFIVGLFDNQFTYQDVVFGVQPTQLQALLRGLFMVCGSQMVFVGEKEKGERLLLVSTHLHNKEAK